MVDDPMELDDAFMHPPIGTEGADHNHAGGDKELLTGTTASQYSNTFCCSFHKGEVYILL